MEKYQANRDNSKRANENNANTIKNTAEVARLIPDSRVKLAGEAILKADELTHGKATKAMGKLTSFNNKLHPGGQSMQNFSNFLSESGTGDVIGKAAKMYGNMKNGGATDVNSLQEDSKDLMGSVSNMMNKNEEESLSSDSINNENSSDSNNSNSSNILSNFMSSKNSTLSNAFSMGGFDVTKLIKSKYILIGGGVFFAFILLMTVFFAARDYGNLDLTNNVSMPLSSATLVEGKVNANEPDPSLAIKYWKNYLNPDDFIYPKDDNNGLSLGAWPKDHDKYPEQLTGYKVYNRYVWPTTPTNDTYTYVYEHNGIDIMTQFGTPVYSPVDGTIRYSEWGHTVNKGSDETAYSITIKADSPITYNGKTINYIYMTHLCGIKQRIPDGSSIPVKQGELIGFTGNAAGTAESVGWAPHLHMTLYTSDYNDGMTTAKIEDLYSISANTVRRAGE